MPRALLAYADSSQTAARAGLTGTRLKGGERAEGEMPAPPPPYRCYCLRLAFPDLSRLRPLTTWVWPASHPRRPVSALRNEPTPSQARPLASTAPRLGIFGPSPPADVPTTAQSQPHHILHRAHCAAQRAHTMSTGMASRVRASAVRGSAPPLRPAKPKFDANSIRRTAGAHCRFRAGQRSAGPGTPRGGQHPGDFEREKPRQPSGESKGSS